MENINEKLETEVRNEGSTPAAPRDLIKIIMPSEGDMGLVDQKGGVILLKPVFFGGECSGPIIQFVEMDDDQNVTVKAAYRVRIRNGELRLAKAD